MKGLREKRKKNEKRSKEQSYHTVLWNENCKLVGMREVKESGGKKVVVRELPV